MHPTTTTEPGAAVQVRLKGHVFTSLENWRRAQDKIPPRSVAVRQLVEQALGACDLLDQALPAAQQHGSAA
jgi:hypothetical protein